ncbi:DUF397 domain-containing protein [Natronoglycomyces albus]|uniref:DUF397 domain-containing protein n=1 Tax=Natronoglycomyces albus TaxID=2811108 RepID=A0A895XLJ8_9ACTN|nr:DUF397 domain-containing protein [Natronoglycomyces albus]QSB04423.1 DUF397 domain-containing protein [Natronoglycomyces albus]
MTNWRKSSRSNSQGQQCVEVRSGRVVMQLRDSKLGDVSPVFDMAPAEFSTFLSSLKR